MTKLGLKLRLRFFGDAMFALYSDEFRGLWLNMTTGDSDFMSSYNKKVNALISKISPESRIVIKELLTLKAMYRMREGSKVLNGDNNKLINNVRQFEDISLKQTIERIEKQEEKDKLKQIEKENKK